MSNQQLDPQTISFKFHSDSSSHGAAALKGTTHTHTHTHARTMMEITEPHLHYETKLASRLSRAVVWELGGDAAVMLCEHWELFNLV